MLDTGPVGPYNRGKPGGDSLACPVQLFSLIRKMSYNGFANYETWNVALWMQNDYIIYKHALANKNLGYKNWARRFRDEFGEFQTADGVDWFSENLDYEKLDEVIYDL